MIPNPNEPHDPRLNDLNLRDEVTDDVPSELPEQLGGGLPTLLPGTHLFRLPSDIAACISTFDAVLYGPDGQPIPDPADPSKARLVQRVQVKFDKDHPLLVVGGPDHGTPVGTSISTRPRNRARKGEAPIPVSDMAYFLRDSLNYQGALTKPVDWVTALRSVAGRVFRAEHGLSAWCSTERVRYVNDPTDTTYVRSIQDPTGQKGCGKRLYTSAFKMAAQNGQPAGYTDIAYCPGTKERPNCYAKLRGFFTFERFLKPTPAMVAEDVPF